MRRPPRLRLTRRFAASTAGVSALEFAIVLPVLLALMLGGIQLVTYINATRKVEQLASSISEMISQAAPPSSSTTIATVDSGDLHFAYDAGLVIFPYLMDDAQRLGKAWWQDISINFASIQFTKTSTACDTKTDKSACYSARVVWTSVGTTGDEERACTTAQTPLTPVDDGTAPSKTTLPRSVYGPGSLIAVDVVFTFSPTFGSGFLRTLRIARSVYVQPRYATLVDYDTTNDDGIAKKCPSS